MSHASQAGKQASKPHTGQPPNRVSRSRSSRRGSSPEPARARRGRTGHRASTRPASGRRVAAVVTALYNYLAPAGRDFPATFFLLSLSLTLSLSLSSPQPPPPHHNRQSASPSTTPIDHSVIQSIIPRRLHSSLYPPPLPPPLPSIGRIAGPVALALPRASRSPSPSNHSPPIHPPFPSPSNIHILLTTFIPPPRRPSVAPDSLDSPF
jgi:hypothetical protein